jgi:hypothetical protein
MQQDGSAIPSCQHVVSAETAKPLSFLDAMGHVAKPAADGIDTHQDDNMG